MLMVFASLPDKEAAVFVSERASEIPYGAEIPFLVLAAVAEHIAASVVALVVVGNLLSDIEAGCRGYIDEVRPRGAGRIGIVDGSVHRLILVA